MRIEFDRKLSHDRCTEWRPKFVFWLNQEYLRHLSSKIYFTSEDDDRLFVESKTEIERL